MNCKRINIILIPHGLNWPQIIRHRKIIIFLFLIMLVAVPCNESHETHVIKNLLTIHRLTKNRKLYNFYKNKPLITRVPNEWRKEHVYIEQRSRPWNSAIIKQHTENIYMDGYLSVNGTRNDTKELLVHRGQNVARKRFKRGVLHLYNMVVCATGCNPLAYKGYGCYCGFLGSGYVIDGIDRCCKMHDWCYDATECLTFSEYFVPYYWRCYHGYKPICAVEHGNWGGSGSCAQRLCECDRSFAECLRRYPCPTNKAMCTTSPWRLIQNVFMTM